MYNDINEMKALQKEITKRYDDDHSSRFREAWRTVSDTLESITEDNFDVVFEDLDELVDDYEKLSTRPNIRLKQRHTNPLAALQTGSPLRVLDLELESRTENEDYGLCLRAPIIEQDGQWYVSYEIITKLLECIEQGYVMEKS